jgi:crotonobetainyl-CoA:carnitine CoA-transferase CaiB-like acyl-CoA transferase
MERSRVSDPAQRVRSGALSGIRVADFSRVLAGPLCTMILGDLGADVVKVERPVAGDDTRSWGPPFTDGGEAAYFTSVNRNKRSVVLDLTDPDGADAARRLALASDVIVENFLPGTMERFGLGYETLAAELPSLVFCSIGAFPPADDGGQLARPGYDLLIQAMSGLMSLTGADGGEPMKVGVALVDVIAGLDAAIGILAALRARETTGRGQRVDVTLFGASVAALVNQASNYLVGGLVPQPMGNAHPNIVPYQVFHASDRPFVLAVGNDDLFRRACAAIGRDDLSADPRFATNADRVRNRDALIPDLERHFATRAADEWLAALDRAGVPAGPVSNLKDVFESPEGRTMVNILYDSTGSEPGVPTVIDPIALSETPATYRMPPPHLGEHSNEILSELADPTGETDPRD